MLGEDDLVAACAFHRSGIFGFAFGVGVGDPADAGHRGFQAESADRSLHLPVIALLADEFGADLDLAVGVGVGAADAVDSEFGAGQCLHQQGTHVGFRIVAGDGEERVGGGLFVADRFSNMGSSTLHNI